jgi:hypothetical protein
MTRSSHEEENEQVVMEVMERYGVQWEFQRILPEMCTDPMYIRESNHCLTIFPSEQNGNGIFLAQFVLKKPPIPEPIVTLPKTNSEILCETKFDHSSKDLLRYSKSAGRYISTPSLTKPKKLPKYIIRAVERLSVPRRVMGEVIGNRKKNGDIDDDRARDDLECSMESLKISRTSISSGFDTKFTGGNIDISIFGISLKKFYTPRAEALKIIKDDIWMRNKFPVIVIAK